MFVQVYADLMTLINYSQQISIGHDMELLNFLQEIQRCSGTLLDCQYQVFHTERRLYGNDSLVNHRLHEKSKLVYKLSQKN